MKESMRPITPAEEPREEEHQKHQGNYLLKYKLKKMLRESGKKHWRILRRHPFIPCVCLLIFAVLCGSGVSIIQVVSHQEEKELRAGALALAKDTGSWFSNQLDQAILPLFSMAQFVVELPIFHKLADAIGPANEPGSAPFVPPGDSGVLTHRNVSGICDDSAVINRFTTIASNIKKQAKMEGILVNLQLAPHSVVCLVHPVNNTEDFEDGIYMDNSGAIGHDLLTDPSRKFIAEATIPSDKVVIAGPLTLKQCATCNPTVEQGFIARLPIEVDDHQIEVDGVSYNKWGFAVAIINWKALVERSDIYTNFAEENLQFRLTRTDKIIDGDDTVSEKVIVLAESPIVDAEGRHSVKTALQTTNNEWEMTVYYESNDATIKSALAACVLVAFGIAILVYTILVQKQIHADVFAEQSAKMVDQARVAAKTEQELNDYIAHEVRNPLSAAISACTFVTAEVHESEPLVTEESRIAVREDVGIIEISLQFVNDLLRSMLDLSRAASNQLSLDVMPVDIMSDIFQPVAAMLYNRDSMFKVLIECPENLVIMTDRLRLKQIILNLGRNSVKFVEKGFVRLRAEVVNGEVHLYVEDSGPGIPEEKQKKLFMKFQESLDVLSQGTGIGLSLCERLVELMGADIYLEDLYHSGIDGCPGARFVLNMKIPPVAVDSIGRDDSSMRKPSISTATTDSDNNTNNLCGQGKELPAELKVLFVDDDMLLRKLFTRSVRKYLPNWTVVEAGSGESALTIIEEQEVQFDLIFLDQYMTSAEKQLLGSETARSLRTKGCKSVICGLSANDMQQKFYAAGANSFVMKPFPCKEEPMKDELRRILCSDDQSNEIV